MADVIRSPRAELDLEDILLQFGRGSHAAVARGAEQIATQCDFLSRFPDTGRDRSDLAPNLRSSVAGKYVNYFRIIAPGIEVARILHGRRDISSVPFD